MKRRKMVRCVHEREEHEEAEERSKSRFPATNLVGETDSPGNACRGCGPTGASTLQRYAARRRAL
ncbi:MAG: hypothetical protein JW878_02840 [Methanomicrobia archaeon]|nr:hypothetical protein [Methanomicrobia archaeon]